MIHGPPPEAPTPGWLHRTQSEPQPKAAAVDLSPTQCEMAATTLSPGILRGHRLQATGVGRAQSVTMTPAPAAAPTDLGPWLQRRRTRDRGEV
jgi:hypothetical protein